MAGQLSEGSLQELVGKFYRRTYVLLGFQQGFANWAEVEGWARETGTRFDAIHGPGCWLVIYDGSKPTMKGPQTLGNVAQVLQAEFSVPIVAVTPVQSQRSGGPEPWVQFVHYYTAVAGDKGVLACSGFAPTSDEGVGFGPKLGATAVYFSESVIDMLGGVIAFGGGKAVEAECKYAVRAGVRLKYFPCQDGKGRGFGPHHAWALGLKSGAPLDLGVGAPELGSGSAGEGPAEAGMCLTMHQPWASLVVAGIKRAEGRVWGTGYRGRLWIHAAAKQPDPAEVATLEAFYSSLYESAGVTAHLPEHYPTSALLGCVNLTNVVTHEQFKLMRGIHPSVFAESESPFVFCCEDPQALPFPMRMPGQHKLWPLPKAVVTAALPVLRPVPAPLPVKFPTSS